MKEKQTERSKQRETGRKIKKKKTDEKSEKKDYKRGNFTERKEIAFWMLVLEYMMILDASVWWCITASFPILLFFLFLSCSILILIDVNKTKWLMAAKPNKVPFDVGFWQTHILVPIGNYWK